MLFKMLSFKISSIRVARLSYIEDLWMSIMPLPYIKFNQTTIKSKIIKKKQYFLKNEMCWDLFNNNLPPSSLPLPYIVQ